MTKGSGRSACIRGGVTYGYRECLRKGQVRKQLLRKFAGPHQARRTCEELGTGNSLN
jgi:hypothetical protein